MDWYNKRWVKPKSDAQKRLRLQCAISQQKTWVASLTTWDGLLVTGDWDFNIHCWNRNNGKLMKSLKGHKGGVLSLVVLDGVLFSGSVDCSILCWNRQGDNILTLSGHTGSIVTLTCDRDTSRLFSGSEDATIRVWNVAGDCLHILQTDSALVSLQFYKGSLYACWNLKKKLFWGVETMKDIRSFKDNKAGITLSSHSEKVTCMCVARNELWSGGYDNKIIMWDVNTGKPKQTMEVASGGLDSICEFEGGVVSAATTLLQCWRLDGTCFGKMNIPSSVTCMVELDGRLFIATSETGVYILDDVNSRNRKWRIMRLLYIAKLKNSWDTCCYASVLPIDMIHQIEMFINT